MWICTFTFKGRASKAFAAEGDVALLLSERLLSWSELAGVLVTLLRLRFGEFLLGLSDWATFKGA